MAVIRWKRFDLDVERRVHLELLEWPNEYDIENLGSIIGNRMYQPIVEASWSEAKTAFECEAELMERMAIAPDAGHEEDLIRDELYEGVDDVFYGLDIGIASSVMALSAAGCVPFSSCNGGAFGRTHMEEYPLVAFYAPRASVPLLLECAEQAGAGLINGDEGDIILHGATIEAIRNFAEHVMSRSEQFDLLHQPIAPAAPAEWD